MSESTGEATGSLAKELEESGLGPATSASVGSVGLALYDHLRGEKRRGQFVGLWPATSLDLAIDLRLDEIERLLQQTAD